MKGIPKDLDEAASIDGASSLQIYLHIILPSIAPVMIVVGLFSFNGAWNDFLWPSIILTNPMNQTLTPGLRLLSGQYEQKWAHMIASCLVSMLPPLLLYLFAQKYFLAGISVQAGVKG
jgi:multiple sugar transport system permease protein